MFDLRSIVIGTVLMLRKYTCINITIYADSNEEDFKNGILALPVIGLAVGFAAFLLLTLRYVYDGLFISVLVLCLYCAATRAVNITDVYRTLNYIVKPKNQSEQIVGTTGVVLLLLLYVSLFKVVSPPAVILMCVAGYSNLMVLSPIIKRNKEFTSVMKHCGRYHVIAAFAMSFALAALFSYRLVISLALTYIVSGLAVSLADRKIKTLPNSVEGLFIEASQIIFLAITYLAGM